ncbi:hypothetical protein [Flavobacterium sp. I3-2]|uniref:hypothetical protein n=1 Tax=Flavobacterium sp. I3-2 TaxID=2748319 RepID=UPI0015AC8609|nr:hypothetical protein [Flavobacterium sp. I3-2]
MMEYLRNRKLAGFIAFLYVGLGTLSVCSIYPADPLYGNWSLYGLLISLPVSAVSFGYRFAESKIIYPVFIIQFAMFLLTFLILSVFIKPKKNK